MREEERCGGGQSKHSTIPAVVGYSCMLPTVAGMLPIVAQESKVVPLPLVMLWVEPLSVAPLWPSWLDH